MQNTFKGGIHPSDCKSITKDLAIEKITPPKKIIIPLSQHIGAPCAPLVAVGDRVFVGQKIGDSPSPVSAPVHSSVSGTVTEIKPCPHPNGSVSNAIVIENDYLEEVHESVKKKGDYKKLSKEELIAIVREAGLVGIGGATFPTATKINSCLNDNIDYLIINGAECEPYLTADYRCILEFPHMVIEGLKIMMKIFSVEKAYIGIEDNKPEAIKVLKSAAKDEKGIEIVTLHTKYPQGGEKQLVFAISGREVPSGKLPSAVGAAVFNLGTCIALYEALEFGMPSISRVLTVTGAGINTPKNIMAKVGTQFSYIIDEVCGGLKESAGKVIMGGPMMGTAVYSLDVPVIKGTSGILCLDQNEVEYQKNPECIRCGKCVDACPMGLLPSYINLFASNGNIEMADKYNALDCIECGACTFVCPAKIHLVQTFRVAKIRIGERRRAMASK